jgi:hypothetical protein
MTRTSRCWIATFLRRCGRSARAGCARVATQLDSSLGERLLRNPGVTAPCRRRDTHVPPPCRTPRAPPAKCLQQMESSEVSWPDTSLRSVSHGPQGPGDAARRSPDPPCGYRPPAAGPALARPSALRAPSATVGPQWPTVAPWPPCRVGPARIAPCLGAANPCRRERRSRGSAPRYSTWNTRPSSASGRVGARRWMSRAKRALRADAGDDETANVAATTLHTNRSPRRKARVSAWIGVVGTRGVLASSGVHPTLSKSLGQRHGLRATDHRWRRPSPARDVWRLKERARPCR